MKLQTTAFVALVLFGASLSHNSHAQSSTFTYQGRLDFSGNPATGIFDLQLHLMDSASGGSALGPAQTFEDVTITKRTFHATN